MIPQMRIKTGTAERMEDPVRVFTRESDRNPEFRSADTLFAKAEALRLPRFRLFLCPEDGYGRKYAPHWMRQGLKSADGFGTIYKI